MTAILSLIFLLLTLTAIIVGWAKNDAMILSASVGFASAMNMCPVGFDNPTWAQWCFIASIVFEIIAVVCMVILRKRGIYIEKKFVITNDTDDRIFKTCTVFLVVALVFYFAGLIGHGINFHEYGKQKRLAEKVEMAD